MAEPLPPKSDVGFWSLVRDLNDLVRLAREVNRKTWKGEALTVARHLVHALSIYGYDVEVLKRDIAFSMAYWCDRRSGMKTAALKEIAGGKYAGSVERLVGRHKAYLAERVLIHRGS